MKGWVGITDHDWYTFLARQSPLDEVNFWAPSPGNPLKLDPGTPWFFKLKRPHDAIAGFACFARYEELPLWLAWDAFETRNGAADLESLRRLIGRNRAEGMADPGTRVGCYMLSQPVFCRRDEWLAPPADWKPNVQRGKYYDLAGGEGAVLDAWRTGVGAPGPQEAPTPYQRRGAARLVEPRLGQGTFRIAVMSAYGWGCAVTGEHSVPALEAAHIRPFAQEGPHRVSNGLSLRADIHRLFDRGYVTVTPDLEFRVSPKLREDYENGRSYYPLEGRRIALPRATSDRPDPDLLAWHNREQFRA